MISHPHHNRAFTLIELLIVVAIISIMAAATMQLSVGTMREGRFGAEAMTVRQQVHLASRSIFRDVKNADSIPPNHGDFEAGSTCLILGNSPPKTETSFAPQTIIYYMDGSNLMRRIEFADSERPPHTSQLVGNISDIDFKRMDNSIEWVIEAQAVFQDQTRKARSETTAALTFKSLSEGERK